MAQENFHQSPEFKYARQAFLYRKRIENQGREVEAQLEGCEIPPFLLDQYEAGEFIETPAAVLDLTVYPLQQEVVRYQMLTFDALIEVGRTILKKLDTAKPDREDISRLNIICFQFLQRLTHDSKH